MLYEAAQAVVLDQFLGSGEHAALMEFALAHEAEFTASRVGSPDGAVVDRQFRRSRVLFDIGEHRAMTARHIRAVLPDVFSAFGRPPFPVALMETQITATNDGEFFRAHSDKKPDPTHTREVSFVYYFHREPKPFTGGELHIYDSVREEGQWRRGDGLRTVVPEQNRIVFFPSFYLHEVLPVHVPSGAFADSRFTLNGWLYR